jgi:putative ABC transport system substrate-binding protein
MKRRQFIAGLGSAAAWPMVGRAQQPVLPLIGYLSFTLTVPPGFLKGLTEIGYVVGQSATLEFRRAQDASQMPALAVDLVRLQPAVICTQSTAGILAVKAATSSIPIVFGTGDDPVKLGLVASLNHPGGNLTGTTNLNVELEAKRLAMMHAILPADKSIAALVNRSNPSAERQARNIEEAALNLGRKVRILRAATEREIDSAFKSIVQEGLGALFVAADAYFGARRNQFVTLAAYNGIPTFYSRREFVEDGGLLSYGTDLGEEQRRQGIYVGRILKGERPADLPVVQTTKFELVINLTTARALGLQLPTTILAIADAVIE